MVEHIEFRMYDVTPGRLHVEVERMRRVAIDPWEGGPSLFARHGVPRPLVAWTSIAGDRHPLFGYLLRWSSLDERDRAFPGFWGCPEWAEIFRSSNAGHPMVDRIDDWLLAPSPAWRGRQTPDIPLDGIHELRINRIAGGQAAAVADYLAEIELSQTQVLGGAVLGLFDVTIGPEMPAIVSLVAWPDMATQEAAAARLDVEPRVLQQRANWRERFGDTLIRRVERHLLRPVDYGVPMPGLQDRS